MKVEIFVPKFCISLQKQNTKKLANMRRSPALIVQLVPQSGEDRKINFKKVKEISRKNQLEEHIKNCNQVPCLHHKLGCPFVGFIGAVESNNNNNNNYNNYNYIHDLFIL
jgi:hypothetical protein